LRHVEALEGGGLLGLGEGLGLGAGEGERLGLGLGEGEGLGDGLGGGEGLGVAPGQLGAHVVDAGQSHALLAALKMRPEGHGVTVAAPLEHWRNVAHAASKGLA
jgi:hypothetical protein